MPIFDDVRREKLSTLKCPPLIGSIVSRLPPHRVYKSPLQPRILIICVALNLDIGFSVTNCIRYKPDYIISDLKHLSFLTCYFDSFGGNTKYQRNTITSFPYHVLKCHLICNISHITYYIQVYFVAFSISQFTSHISHVLYQISNVQCPNLYDTLHMSHFTCHISHIKLHK